MQKYVHEVLVNRFVKLAQEKNVVRWGNHLDMKIAVDWYVKPQTKQNKMFLQPENSDIFSYFLF